MDDNVVTLPTASVEELGTAASLSLLRTQSVGRVAFTDDVGMIVILPVNYAVDRGTVLFRTGPGSKLRAGNRGEVVAFEVDGFDADAGAFWSVLMQGRVEGVRQPYDLEDIEGVPVQPIDPRNKPFTMRIVWSQMTGRRIAPEVKP